MKCIFCHTQKIWIFIVGNIIKDNQIKGCKIFSPYTQLKFKGFGFQDIKKTKKYCVFINNQNKNIICNLKWKQYLFDFDARYCDQNLIFVFDQSTCKKKYLMPFIQTNNGLYIR